MFLEASSCPHGSNLGTKRNTFICWTCKMVKKKKQTKRLLDPSELLQRTVLLQEWFEAFCGVKVTRQLVASVNQWSPGIAAEINSHSPHKRIELKLRLSLIWNEIEQLSTCTFTVHRTKKRKGKVKTKHLGSTDLRSSTDTHPFVYFVCLSFSVQHDLTRSCLHHPGPNSLDAAQMD